MKLGSVQLFVKQKILAIVAIVSLWVDGFGWSAKLDVGLESGIFAADMETIVKMLGR